ncbi:MAG: efflux RND transporter periplasmic adaptor subunit [Alphaproteobacteria bacterium]|nr:efflux RND transporter periplasmic adaptor subunit [Alphaproteobacteria bacterium]
MPFLKRLFSTGRKILLPFLILIFGYSGFNYLVATKPEKPLQPRNEQVWTVDAVVVDFKVAYPEKSSFGQVEASRKSALNFNIPGEVETVAEVFRNGNTVSKGVELARLDRDLLLIAKQEIMVQLDANKTNIEELAIQLDLRQKNFERINQMQAAAVTSQANLDEARLALSMAKNALQQATQQKNQLELSLQRANKNLEDAVLRAPFDGIISNVQIGRGLVLSPGISVGSMTDISSLEASFVVPSDVFADTDLLIGSEVKVIWRSGGREIKTLMSKVERAEGNVAVGQGGGRLYADIPVGDDGNWIIPEGAFVEIIYSSGRVENVAQLPEAALYDDNSIFVIKNDRTDRRRVEVVQKSEGLVYVRGDINDGDVVVATRLPALGDGILVKPSGS